MTDKERILAKIKSLLNETNYESYTDEVLGRINLLKELKSYIDSLQEEPVSDDFEEALAREWQGYNDRGAATVDALEDNTQELAFAKGFYRGWNYPKQLPVNEDFEKTFISMVKVTHENNGSYSLHEYAQRLYNIARDTLRKSISDNLEKAALSCYPKMSRISEPHGITPADNESHYIGDANEDNRKAFKKSAEWLLEQIMKG